MPTFEVEHNGQVYEAEGPDMESVAKAFSSMGGDKPEAPKSGGFFNDDDKVGGRAARLLVQGIPNALGTTAALVGDAAINTGKAMFNTGRRSVGKPEIDNPPLPLTTALHNTTSRLATNLGLPELPQEGWAGTVGRGLETVTETALGGGAAKLVGAGIRAAAPAIAPRLAPRLADDVARLGENIPAQIGVGLAGQAGSEGLGALAPDSMAARLIGAGVGTALGVGGHMGATVGIPAAKQFYRNATIADPEAVAAARLRGMAVDPEAAIRSLDGNGELVPGSKPTTAQQSGDLGLVQGERDAQTNNAAAFQARRDEQAAARSRAIESVQPAGQGNTADLLDFAQRTLREEDAALGQAETNARNVARGRAEDLAPTETRPEDIGKNIRQPVAANDEAARQNVNRLYEAVDPERRLTTTAQGVKEAAGRIYGDLTETARRRLTPDELSLTEQIDRYGPEVPFRELVDLDKEVEAARRAAFEKRGPDYARLSALKGAIREHMGRSAAERIEADPSIAARVRGVRDGFEGSSTGAENGGIRGEAQSVQAGAVSPPRDQASAGNGGPGPAPGSDGLPKGARDRRKGLTLSQFIARNGGLELDGEAAARDYGNVRIPGVGGNLARPNGRSIDGYWRNKLIDAGYLPPDADGGASRDITKELFDALERERSGGPATRTAEMENRGAVSGVDDETAAHQAAHSQISQELRAAGIREGEISSRALNDAAEMLARGDEKNAIDAYERAVQNLDDEPTPRPTYPEVPEPEGGFPNALGGLRYDEAAKGRYEAAGKAHFQRKQTYGRGTVGAILKESGQKGVYQVSDASVAVNAFKPGPKGAERITALVEAGAPHSAIADAAALSLASRRSTFQDGVLNPAGFQDWRNTHASAFSALPADVKARFASASLASQALEAATARRRDAAAAAGKSALGKIAGAGDVLDVQGRVSSLLSSPQNSNRDMGELVRRTRGNADASEGLKRVVADEISKRVVSASEEVGTSGEKSIKPDALAKLIRDKRSILTQVFGAQHVETMAAVADDLVRAKRSTTGGVKIPGISNTAQDTRLDRMATQASEGNLLWRVTRAGGVGFAAGGPKGLAVGVGSTLAANTIGKLRAAGLRKVDDLLTEAFLEPAIAKALLIKGRGAPNAEKVIVSRLLAKYANPAASAAPTGDSE